MTSSEPRPSRASEAGVSQGTSWLAFSTAVGKRVTSVPPGSRMEIWFVPASAT
ncbi:MAG: hypothetical protein ACRDYF_09615 [Acidimicrobiia bacterium]